MRFSVTCRKIDVNYLSIFKFAFLDAYNFKLLAKVKNSTEKTNVAAFLFLSIAKSKHMSYNIFAFLFDIVDIDRSEIFTFNFDRLFFCFFVKHEISDFSTTYCQIYIFENARWIYVEFSFFFLISRNEKRKFWLISTFFPLYYLIKACQTFFSIIQSKIKNFIVLFFCSLFVVECCVILAKRILCCFFR